MTAYVHAVTDFVVQHPNWASLLVFLTAAAEAIAVIGAIVPGTAILIGVGAVVGLGHLPLWPILVWATLGAIVGDGVSYWLGHRYRHHIVRIWPFSRRPQLLSQGEAFVRRHGGKSVVIGRFLPVMRAVVPLVAGVLGMSPVRFYVANILSAVAWAPLHILPGVAIGALLVVVGGISGRLLAVLVGVIILAIAGVWLLQLAVVRALPLLARAHVAAVSWARGRTGVAPRLVMSAFDPDDPSASTVLLLGLVLLACGIGFVGIVQDVVARDPLVQADAAISHLLQSMRTSWSDRVMIVLTMLGDTVVSASVAFVTIGWLAWRRAWRLAAGFGVALGLAAAFVMALKAVLHVPRPILFSVGADAFSFPSGHATMAATLYGMLAWLISASLSGRWRLAPLAVGGALVGMIAASRIYLAAHWPSDVGAGVLFGFGLAAIFGLVFRRAASPNLQPAGLASVTVATLLIAGTWHSFSAFDAGLTTYARRDDVAATMSRQAWLGGDWQRLPRRRIDLDGETEEPFVLQWAGSAEQLRKRLIAAGWTSPIDWSLQSAAGFARSSTVVTALPAWPLLHDGRPPSLTLVMPGATADGRAVLRAWPSGFTIGSEQGRRPILIGSVIREQVTRRWSMVSLPQEDGSVSADQEKGLSSALSATARLVRISGTSTAETRPCLLLAFP
ncbi:MAG: VTT domain-containing protein [Reyranella sp.]|nr:VTT domain-containing protein [Reyranella sp.]MDP3163498.1 VTT domain-containing protein [Reyranella sp.]